MINRIHTRPYGHNICSNKVKYSTVTGAYCTTNRFKASFCVPEFSRIEIISHHFHVDKNEGESGIDYTMIIFRDLTVQLGLMAYFKRQVIKGRGAAVPMKEPTHF